MPKYVEATTGLSVDAATATYAGGRIKPGFHEIAADGERLHFHIGMRDAASSGVFLTDKPDDHSWSRNVRDVALAARNGGAPAIELARLTDAAERDFAATQARLSEQRRNAWKGAAFDDGAATRDAIRAARYR